MGPHGEKEASYFTVREIWSPVQIEWAQLPGDFSGALPVENRYYETPLNECSFAWKLVNFSTPFSEQAESSTRVEGRLAGPNVGPGEQGILQLPLPANWRESGALELSAFSRTGVELMKWSWPIDVAKSSTAESGAVKQTDGKPFEVTAGKTVWRFSPASGQLVGCSVAGTELGFGRGPVLYAGTLENALEFSNDWKAEAKSEGDSVVVESKNINDGSHFRWTVSPDGSAALDYEFAAIENALAYCAVGFDLEESNVASKRWLGAGPHRIWGNRLKGPQFGLWEDEYNDNITGVNWGKPEFKGIFGRVDWMEIGLKSGSSLLVDADSRASLGILRPKNADETRNEKNGVGPVHAWWHYPESGGLHLFHKLPGVGTKFANAEALGPQGEPKKLTGTLSGRIVFRAKGQSE